MQAVRHTGPAAAEKAATVEPRRHAATRPGMRTGCSRPPPEPAAAGPPPQPGPTRGSYPAASSAYFASCGTTSPIGSRSTARALPS
ncbi:hypothetical protein GCM10009834_37820 [Streptomonospora arabica]